MTQIKNVKNITLKDRWHVGRCPLLHCTTIVHKSCNLVIIKKEWMNSEGRNVWSLRFNTIYGFLGTLHRCIAGPMLIMDTLHTKWCKWWCVGDLSVCTHVLQVHACIPVYIWNSAENEECMKSKVHWWENKKGNLMY